MLIVGNDTEIARRSTTLHHYGSTSSCWVRKGTCNPGKLRINLSGTGLRLKPRVRWQGTTPNTWVNTWVTKSELNDKDGLYYIECQGSRIGKCRPVHGLEVFIKGC